MIFLIGLILTSLNGWLFLGLLSFSAPILEKLSLSFLLSLGLHTVIFFVISLISFRPSAEIYWLSLICITLCLILLNRKHVPKVPTKITISLRWPKPKYLTVLSWSLILILFLVSLSYTLIVPVHTTDSLHLYDFRAKVLYYSASLEEVKHVVDAWYQYPMFTTLANLFVRYWGMSNPSLIYPLLYLCFTFIFFYQLRRHASTQVASMTSLLMFSTPLIYWQSRLDGLTNLPFAIFFCSSILYLLNINTRQVGPYIIGTLLVALSTWTRVTEPFWLVPMAFMTLLVLRIKNIYLLLINFYLLHRIRNLWDIYADNRKHISITTGLKTLAKHAQVESEKVITDSSALVSAPKDSSLNVEQVITDSSALVSAPKDSSLNVEQVISLISQITTLFITAGRFIFPIIINSLSPVIYVFFLVLGLDLLFARLSRTQFQLFLIITAIFVLLWSGSAYSSVAFDNWQELGNSLSRILGFFVPLMWFFVGISPTIKTWESKAGLIDHDDD